MSISQIDLKCALIIVDLVKGLAHYPVIDPFAEIVARNAKLAEVFRSKGHLVVLVTVAGGAPGRTEEKRPPFEAPPEFTEFVPELTPQAGDHVVTKRSWGAFQNTGLDEFLRNHGVTQVFVTGVATSVGAESTARQAYEAGYHVVAITDAMTDIDAERQLYSLQSVYPRISEMGSTAEVLAKLN